MTDRAGNLIERVDYDIWGTPEFDSAYSTDPNSSVLGAHFAFTGRRWEPETGLYDYRFRTFDPTLGRFLSRDPIGTWGDPLNLGNSYTYTGNNPWSWVDPWGLEGDGYFANLRALWRAAFTQRDGDGCAHRVQTAGDYNGGHRVVGAVSHATTTATSYLDATTETAVEGGKVVLENAPVTGQAMAAVNATGAALDGDFKGAALEGLGALPAGKAGQAARTANSALGIAADAARGGTYVLVDPSTGRVLRTGRTNDLARRAGEHKRDPATKDLEFVVDRRTDYYAAQRGREQIIYDLHPSALAENGGLNKKRPIRPDHPLRCEYLAAGAKVQ